MEIMRSVNSLLQDKRFILLVAMLIIMAVFMPKLSLSMVKSIYLLVFMILVYIIGMRTGYLDAVEQFNKNNNCD